MNTTDKYDAVDYNGAVAGEFEPDPSLNTIDKLASAAGVEQEPGEPLNLYETVKSRDEDRLEEDR